MIELIHNNKAARMYLKYPERVLPLIKKSKVVSEVSPGVHEVVVHFGLDEMQTLNNLGVKGLRSPIATHYNWPGIYKPMAHQITTAEFLTLNKRAYCWNEMGTAKTGTMLWAADYLMTVGKIKRALVICPVSIMHSAWVSDAFKTIMHRHVGVAHGSRDVRKKVINGDYEFVVINYDGVETVVDELKNKFELVILDEANYIKNVSTQRWKAINSLVDSDTWLWLATGTPAAQSPEDAYGLAKMCTPQRVPKFKGAWKDKVMIKVGMFRYIPHPKATELVHQALQPAIRFTKEECLDLPDRVFIDREVPMTPQQEKYYKQIKTRMMMEVEGETVTAVHAAAKINKLLQISLGVVYSDDGSVIQFDAKNRLNEMTDVVRESSHKVVVFVPFRHAIDLVTEHLRGEGFTVEVVHGGVSASERKRIFNNFQTTSDPHVLVIQPQSAAHGVTLTAASTTIWFGPTSSAEVYLQGNARCYRAGQTNKVTIVKLCGTEDEKKVYKSLESKSDTTDILLGMYEDLFKEKK